MPAFSVGCGEWRQTNMNDKPDTWMPFYVGDYVRDTLHLSTEEHGAYLLLILHYWSTGEPLPDDPRRLAIIAKMGTKKWNGMGKTIRGFFRQKNGFLYHPRIEGEIKKARKISEKRASAGRKGGEKRQANAKQLPTPSQSPKKEPEAKASEGVPPDENLIVRPAHVTPDLKGTVFGECLSALAAWLDKPPDGLRPLLGRWCRDHGEARVIAAFGAVDLRADGVPDDPVSWIENWLRTRALTPGEGDMVGGSEPALLAWRGRILREIERRRGNEEAERIGDAVTRGEKWATDALYAIDRQMKGAGT